MGKSVFGLILAIAVILTACGTRGETLETTETEPNVMPTESLETTETEQYDSLLENSEAVELQQEGDNEAMGQIWNISDPNDFVIALSDHVAKKCRYGEDMSVLTEPERVFYITQILEMEVNNGGFSQFFYNSSGNFSNELAYAFTQIGAVKTAEICQRAISAFGTELPSDWFARQDMLDEYETDEVSEILDACDMAFYAYEEDLNALNYQYVLSHREFFT